MLLGFVELINYFKKIVFLFPGLQRLFRDEMNFTPSLASIKRTRYRIGWRKSGPRYCQIVREANRVARLAFAERCASTKETFEDVLFTDESTIWLERHGRICFTKKGQRPKLKPKAKHPFKAHVWAGISTRGATPIVVFTGIMRKEFYVEAILQDTLIPFVSRRFPDGYRFQQDNDPKHKSKEKQQKVNCRYCSCCLNYFSFVFTRQPCFAVYSGQRHKLLAYTCRKPRLEPH